MRNILPTGISTILCIGVPAALLSACSTPEATVRAGLIKAGISRPIAECMANRMVHRLSLLQLRRLAALGKADRARNLEQFVHRVRSLDDPEIISVTASSAALCATGLVG